MTKQIPTDVAAEILMQFYVDHLDTPMTDYQAMYHTGLTASQVTNGKKRLREALVKSEHLMYVTKPGPGGGTYLTERTDEARHHVNGRLLTWAKQMKMLQASTLTELDLRDPSVAILVREIDRAIEDLEFIAEVA